MQDTTQTRSPDLLRFALGLTHLHFGMLESFPDPSLAGMSATLSCSARLRWPAPARAGA